MSTIRNKGSSTGIAGWFRLRKPERRADRLRKRERSSDMVVAGLGIALGLVCAFFPWYVFFNQEKFGIRAVRFSGGSASQIAPENLTYQPSLVGRGFTVDDVPLLELDRIATGTVPGEGEPSVEDVPISNQPFPGDLAPEPEYRVVHIANGRAMIEDKEGLYVVETGSVLPDKSRVTSIEQRGGNWVVVTSSDKIVSLQNTE